MERPYKMRGDKWDCMELMSLDNQKDHEIPWTSKNYACSFCKRQFRSAQALGGHMNVHRRDRARLRLLPSTLNSECRNHNTLINPILSSPASSSFSVRFLPYNPQFLTSSPNSPLNCLGLSSEKDKWMFNSPHDDHKRERMAKKSLRLGSISMEESGDHFKDYFVQKGKSKESMTRLDLEMGLLNDHQREDHHVDLELRLGH